MARKIKAKTLARLIVRYLDDFGDEAAEAVAESQPDDGAELLGLLPPDHSWTLLRSLPVGDARAWLEHSDEETLRRLVLDAKPDAPPDQDLPALTRQAIALLTA
ncbi:MAG: hypothetical protein R2748_33530 [Bryobacterales bacterium]